MSGDVDIDTWLAECGYGLPASKTRARETLEAEGLTRAGKTRMSTEKLPRAAELLGARFILHCPTPECVAFARASGREPLACTPKATCARCGGSDNQRAVRDLLDACRARGVGKVVVVGGSPAVHEELTRLLAGSPVALRLVDGTERRTIDRARADVEWADLVLVWGGTELHHKVSMQYTSVPPPLKRKVVHVPRRGIAQLLAGAVEHLRR